jgi:hypothetical protein
VITRRRRFVAENENDKTEIKVFKSNNGCLKMGSLRRWWSCCLMMDRRAGSSHRSRIPSPLPLRVAKKTGSYNLNDEFTFLLPTGIGERF